MKKEFNTLPMTTFRWTKANSTPVEWQEQQAMQTVNSRWTGDVEILTRAQGSHPLPEYVPTSFQGAHPEVLGLCLTEQAEIYELNLAAGMKKSLSWELDCSEVRADWQGALLLDLPEDTELQVELHIHGSEVAAARINLAILGNIAAGAKLSLTKVHVGSACEKVAEHRYFAIADGAEVDCISAEMGTRELYYHSQVDLQGEAAKIAEECIYIADSGQHIDLYYDRNHYGKKTDSHLATYGALLGTAKKVFRGCINFKQGASGSVGNEEDYAILLSPRAKNISLPLLLCTEDDVQGNHASSAGQMDKEKLFYLQSRGFSAEAAKRIIVESMVRPVIDRIARDDLREAVLLAVGEKMKGSHE